MIKDYIKILRILKWTLVIISVLLFFMGFSIVGLNSFGGAPVDILLYWAYLMIFIAAGAVIAGSIVITAINEPQKLKKLGIGALSVVLLCSFVYLISSSSEAVGLTTEQPSASSLKLTTAVLNLTYLVGGLAVLSIIGTEIWSVAHNKIIDLWLKIKPRK